MSKILSLNKNNDNSDDEVLWECKVCGVKVTDSTDKENGPLGLNMGGLPVFICTECGSLSVHVDVVKDLKKSIMSQSSNIIVPTSDVASDINNSSKRFI